MTFVITQLHISKMLKYVALLNHARNQQYFLGLKLGELCLFVMI